MKTRFLVIFILGFFLLLTTVLTAYFVFSNKEIVDQYNFSDISATIDTNEFININCNKSVNPNLTISNSQIAIKTSARVAGAIDSIKFNGTEIVNSFDHGREVQYAFSINDYGECLNPTEAGSAADMAENSSSSQYLEGCLISSNKLYTKSKMAFWLRPGEKGYCSKTENAINTSIVSDYVISKIVEVGYNNNPNLIRIVAKLDVPEFANSINIEAPTGYLNREFGNFYSYTKNSGNLSLLTVSDPLYGPFNFIKHLPNTELPVLTDNKISIASWANSNAEYNVYSNKPYDGPWCKVENSPSNCVGYGGHCGANPYACEGKTGKQCCNGLWPGSNGACLCANSEKTASAKWNTTYYLTNVNKGSIYFESFILIDNFDKIDDALDAIFEDLITQQPSPKPTLTPTPVLTSTPSLTPSQTLTPTPTLSPIPSPTNGPSVCNSDPNTTDSQCFNKPINSVQNGSCTCSWTGVGAGCRCKSVSTTPTITTSPTPTSTPKPTVSPTQSGIEVGIKTVICGAADSNSDGKIDIVDIASFLQIYNKKCTDNSSTFGSCGGKDADKNGLINIIDLSYLINSYFSNKKCSK